MAALRQSGCSVQSLHRVGQGCPDLLIGFIGRTYLAEVKVGDKGLNKVQVAWWNRWRGSAMIFRSVDEAIEWRLTLTPRPHG